MKCLFWAHHWEKWTKPETVQKIIGPSIIDKTERHLTTLVQRRTCLLCGLVQIKEVERLT